MSTATTDVTNDQRKPRLLALAGSLRKDSYNRQLAASAAQLARDAGAEVVEVNLRDYPLPLFDEDLEAAGIPDNARALKDLFATADGLLIASPEYNGSVTAVLKNMIDWVSRPDGQFARAELFAGRRAALFATSPGGLGGMRGLNHLRDILQPLGTWISPTMLAVPSSMNIFDEHGKLVDEMATAQLRDLVQQTIAAIPTTTIQA
ncbi:NAD(P)H-dependent oxidoreductase [Microbulbifer sp. CAU 1566]|uniref:NADPH-dependent FMN reductase n=1 Tax=Microbulbifer sp. CAU 1566 TaxID=2933269 RepID=UPI0020047563|nr:NADPH-dependent FMN reductase [Microbulbifer sp. CAU 1566]MCK7598197.1 NAD(P)H-dependent oxidoreductase [Microbulbifer sp. CAU 1566]